MSQKLQMDADLTLEKAKKTVRQKEAVVQQHQELQGSKEDPIVLDEIQPRDQPRHWEFQQIYMYKGGPNRKPSQHNNTSRGNNKFQHQYRGGAGPNRINNYSKTCMRCGEPRHPTRSQCPACRKCQRVGHYAEVCLSKIISKIEAAHEVDRLRSRLVLRR